MQKQKTAQEVMYNIDNIIAALDSVALPGNRISGRQFCATILGSMNDLELVKEFINQQNQELERLKAEKEKQKTEYQEQVEADESAAKA